MADFMRLLMLFSIGIALGVVFFGGLWWTVLKGIHTKRPGLFFSISLILRTGITLTVFILISKGSFERLAACLLGFFLARWVVMRYTRHILETQSPTEKGGES